MIKMCELSDFIWNFKYIVTKELVHKLEKGNIDLCMENRLIMIKTEFLEKYDYWYSLNEKRIKNDLDKRKKLLSDFLTMYPSSEIEKMDIDEYVVGKKSNSFCWWVEDALSGLGDIRYCRLTAFQRFGIYYDSDKKDYLFGNKNTKKTKFGSDKDEIFKNIIIEIVKLLNDDKNSNYKGLEANKLNPLFKNKLLFLYNSEKWLPIYSDSDLNIILTIFDIPFDKSADRIYKRKALHDFFQSLERPDITPLTFIDFIYDDLGYRAFLRSGDSDRIKTDVKSFKLKKVKTLKELMLESRSTKSGLVSVSETIETLVQKRITGKKGEEIIKSYLLSHKTELGIIGDIDCPCEKDDSKHYDFSYKKSDGTTIYLDSKATRANRNGAIIFEMSDAEFDFMKSHEDSYFIMYINDVFNGDIIKMIPANLIIGKPIKYRIAVEDDE